MPIATVNSQTIANSAPLKACPHRFMKCPERPRCANPLARLHQLPMQLINVKKGKDRAETCQTKYKELFNRKAAVREQDRHRRRLSLTSTQAYLRKALGMVLN
jgi:hypothetical protein